jgi:hypothetical protein
MWRFQIETKETKMPRFSFLALLALTGALAVGPAMAAPQFAGTNTAPGEGGDFTVDCSDQQYRYMPFCENLNGQATRNSAPSMARRTSELSCPSGDVVPAGTDRAGHRLYRCDTSKRISKKGGPAMTFSPGY